MVEGPAVGGEEIAHAGVHGVVPVPGGDSLHPHVPHLEGAVDAAGEGPAGPDDPAAGFLGDPGEVVVVAVLVGDEHQIGGQVVACPNGRVKVDYHAGPGDDAATGVPLKEQNSHRGCLHFLLIGVFCAGRRCRRKTGPGTA